ncbi:unnamed protein product [Rodentolepis nana]|uniref:UPF0769 protein C21orf59 homolog n=1 Tax=Rodentolepis nana TaxID=102285 RepID=A0A0R3TCC9_RODNA|nr:unnamed protein product [Rodentolepis nana]
MVRLVVKKGDQPQFLLDTPAATGTRSLIETICEIYNFRLKVFRIADYLSELADHGVSLPPNMQGLTDEQIEELKLVDEWGQKCIPSGGFVENKDVLGRRNGKAPNEKMTEVLTKTATTAKELISKKLIDQGKALTKELVNEAFMMLSGAVTIVYPMGLPPYDPIQMELKNEEDLSGTHAGSEVIPFEEGTLWFSGKELLPGKLLSDYVGMNEKTKIIVKIQKRGSGAPAREAVISEADQKAMMAFYYRRQEELKKLEENDDDSYLNSVWSEPGQLKRQFHGLGDIKWGPR